VGPSTAGTSGIGDHAVTVGLSSGVFLASILLIVSVIVLSTG
jgi:hypothetical protein